MKLVDPEGVGRRLYALRTMRRRQSLPEERRLWSLRGVAARIGVNSSSLSRLERGGFSSTDLLPRLADLYGVTVHYLLTGDGDKSRDDRETRIITMLGSLTEMELALVEAVVLEILRKQKTA